MAEEIKIVLAVDGADKVSTALNKTSEALKDTALEANKAGEALDSKLKKGAGSANTTLLNLNRVIQDAPYGLIGIANNIDPLVTSFQKLQNETKDSGGAFKLLLNSLSGPTGIAVAISAVTSLLIKFGGDLFKSSNSVESFDDKLLSLSKDLKSVVIDFESFVTIADKAQKLGEIQIKTVFNKKEDQEALIRQSQFITISEKLTKVQEDRAKATSNLIRLIQSNWSSEDLRNKAISEAKKIVDELNKKESELIDAREEQAALNRLATEEEKRAAVERLKNIDTIAKTIAALREAQKDARNVANALGTTSFDNQIKLITAAIDKLITKFNLDPKNALILQLKAEIDEIELRKKTVQFKDVWQNASERLLKGGLQVKLTPVLPQFKTLPPGFKDYADTIQKAFENIAVNIGQNFAESLGLALIGQATLGDVFSGIFEQLGAGVEALGKQMIEIGTLAVLAQQSLSELFLNPFAAIGVGIALTALGAALKGLMGKQKFAVGTNYAPGGLALVGERGPEMVSLPKGSRVLPAAQTSAIMGGNNQVEVFGVLRGQDIYFSNKRYQTVYNRQT